MPTLLETSHLPSGVQAETYQQKTETRAAGWADGQPSLQIQSVQEGTCLRILEKGGQGLVTTHSEISLLDPLIEKARAMAQMTPKDPDRQFAEASYTYKPSIPSDLNLFDLSIGEMLEKLRALEKIILKVDSRIKKVVRLEWESEKNTHQISNSHGLAHSKENSSSQLLFEVLAEDGNQSEVGWDMDESRFSKDLNLESLARSVADQALKSLGGKPIKSGSYPIVVHPRVGVQFLDLLSEALSAEEVYLGRSFLQGFEGKPIANKNVTLIDDPFLQKQAASEHFDDEGVPRQTLTVVSEGQLKSYFYDLRSAKRQKKESTGNGVRQSLSSLPQPGPSNFYLKPGEVSPQEFFQSADSVFLLEEVMGLHMADPMTGEFSLGASGTLYQKGKFAHPVRGVTIAGQLRQLFEKVTHVGNDLRWYGSLGSPSFLVSGLMVSGQN